MVHSSSWASLEQSWQNTSWEMLHCLWDGRWTHMTLSDLHTWDVYMCSIVAIHMWKCSHPSYIICNRSHQISTIIWSYLRTGKHFTNMLHFGAHLLSRCTSSALYQQLILPNEVLALQTATLYTFMILITLDLWRRQVCLILWRIVLQQFHCSQRLLHWLRADRPNNGLSKL